MTDRPLTKPPCSNQNGACDEDHCKCKLLYADDIQEMFPNTDFANGITNTISSQPIMWVAHRNETPTWLIFYSPLAVDFFDLPLQGLILADLEAVRKLVPCTDEAFKLYKAEK